MYVSERDYIAKPELTPQIWASVQYLERGKALHVFDVAADVFSVSGSWLGYSHLPISALSYPTRSVTLPPEVSQFS